MGETSKIEWTDATWNPVTGCTKVSPGCDHCYAEGIANRFRGPAFPNGFDVTLRENRLTEPFRWREPRRVFVNSMSDLFHEAVPDTYIERVFMVMANTPQHTYQVLTKRHARMRSFVSQLPGWWPLPNVWLGVSVEDQKWANIRVPALIGTTAAVRFLSCEPLLGPVSLTAESNPWGRYFIDGIDWVIVGGESGAAARPMRAEWARTLRDECEAHETAFFFKQWGSHDEHGKRMSKHAAGRLLDGRTWDEYPQAVDA
jgi:protein gp37